MQLSEHELKEIAKIVTNNLATEETFKTLSTKAKEYTEFYATGYLNKTSLEMEIGKILTPVVKEILNQPNFIRDIRAQVSKEIDGIILEVKEKIKDALSNVFE